MSVLYTCGGVWRKSIDYFFFAFFGTDKHVRKKCESPFNSVFDVSNDTTVINIYLFVFFCSGKLIFS